MTPIDILVWCLRGMLATFLILIIRFKMDKQAWKGLVTRVEEWQRSLPTYKKPRTVNIGYDFEARRKRIEEERRREYVTAEEAEAWARGS